MASTGQSENNKSRKSSKNKGKRNRVKKNKHRARLIVRNLPFAATEETLKDHFSKFGEVTEVKILKKEDGQLLGCGFVQFTLVQKAAKAKHHLHGKMFLDREILCDWAIAKDKYVKQKREVEIKEEPADTNFETLVKTEVKEESDSEEKNISDTEESNGESEDNSEKMEEESEVESDEESDKQKSKARIESNDVVEGRTIFIKNAPFTATDKDIRDCFSKYGPLYYALVCTDSLTEHSKGTAFVKFRNKEDADTCLQTEICLMGHTLDCQRALSKTELKTMSDEKSNKHSKHQDSRNLYLVKEGLILAGTKAAENVSAADMAKRLQLEQYKTQMLKNLNMFVARTRLIVHNIPESWDDTKLRDLFKKYSNTKAVIKEARIMRNMRSVDHNGIGQSKEFGFVTFTTHEAALEALRAVNNNPKIFSSLKRPIVAFSIENKSKLKSKEKRLQNSLTKNPNFKGSEGVKKKREYKKNKGLKKSAHLNEETESFSGVSAKLGNTKMRSRFNLRTQNQLHHQQLKKEKKLKKKKSLKGGQEEYTKDAKQKVKKRNLEEKDNFSQLVDNYKQKLVTVQKSLKKKKWYD